MVAQYSNARFVQVAVETSKAIPHLDHEKMGDGGSPSDIFSRERVITVGQSAWQLATAAVEIVRHGGLGKTSRDYLGISTY